MEEKLQTFKVTIDRSRIRPSIAWLPGEITLDKVVSWPDEVSITLAKAEYPDDIVAAKIQQLIHRKPCLKLVSLRMEDVRSAFAVIGHRVLAVWQPDGVCAEIITLLLGGSHGAGETASMETTLIRLEPHTKVPSLAKGEVRLTDANIGFDRIETENEQLFLSKSNPFVDYAKPLADWEFYSMQ